MPQPDSSLIAWWGAILSTLLASVKLWELWRDRFQLEVTYSLRSDPSKGNDILIRNLTNRALILSHWELLHGEGRWPNKRFESIEMADLDDGDQRIEPYSTYTLNFSDQRHFEWGHKELNGRSIYIHLHIAGRKRFFRKVYPD